MIDLKPGSSGTWELPGSSSQDSVVPVAWHSLGGRGKLAHDCGSSAMGLTMQLPE